MTDKDTKRESEIMVKGLIDWQKVYSDKKMHLAELTNIIRPGQRIFIGTGCSEPQKLTSELVKKQNHLADCEIIHFLTLGETKFFSDYEPSYFRHNALFIGSTMREAVKKGYADYTPIMLSDIPKLFLSGRKHIDVALIQVSPPDKYGWLSLGINVDINKAVVNSADIVIAQINEQMPRTMGDSFIHMSQIYRWFYTDEPLIEAIYEEPDEKSQKIGKYIARLVENGSTLQMGIGQIPNAVIKFLKDKKDLSIYSEVFSDGVIDLVESGVISAEYLKSGRSKIMCTFVMGSNSLYQWVDNNPFVEFRTTDYLNNPFNIAKNDKQVSINAALTVDLTGQVNSDSIGNEFYSGIGGQADFERGAALAPHGKPIMTLSSTTADGKKSRIVPVLEEGAGVVLPRGDVHYVVTEWGFAYLHGKTIRERALQLIGIAHPDFRQELLDRAKELKYVYEDQMLPTTKDGIVVIYPESYESYYETPSGETIFVRPVKPTDERMLQDLYYSLSMQDRVLRFFTPQKRFPHKQTQSKVNVDYEETMALVGVVGEEDNQKIISAGSYYLNRNTNMAEIAFTVHDDYRNKGITKYVLEQLINIAKEKGITGFNGEVLPENKAMIHVLESLDYDIQFHRYEGEMMFSFKFSGKKS
ncbi:MAG: GNAT family N-acetyltransferase [Candidatus Lokiarchaeota archaeon]|nr:GNAT family N-acetyltransferase [Candidatus Lokiarchaeota archaeon]